RSGWASGFPRRRLRALRRGDFPPDAELDLHGLSRAAAHRAVREALAAAIADGQRCLLIVHGRGARSPDGPVLREALPAWLVEPPHGARVLAFAAAAGRAGGATCVLLRGGRGAGAAR